MPTSVLLALNIAFFVLHTGLVLFNTFGWLWRRAARWNLITLGITAFSWGIMGIYKGLGYCLCTDLHWQVRRALGIHDLSQTYIQLLVQELTGWLPPISLTTNVTATVFFLSLIASVLTNVRASGVRVAAKRDDSNL